MIYRIIYILSAAFQFVLLFAVLFIVLDGWFEAVIGIIGWAAYCFMEGFCKAAKRYADRERLERKLGR